VIFSFKGENEMKATVNLKGYFKRNYPLFLVGRDWLRRVPTEDRAALSHVGAMAAGFGSPSFSRKGGLKRARTATRDNKGRFLPSGDKNG
jgi:hypothetical protein